MGEPFQIQTAFLTDSIAKLFHILNSTYQVRLMKSLASELGLKDTSLEWKDI